MRVLVVRLGSMGDVIHALPAVAALRAAHPEAHIGWTIERRWTPLLVADGAPLSGPRSPQRTLVDSVHVVNTLDWRRAPFSGKTWGEMRNAFRAIRTEKYDVAIDFQGSIKSAVVGRFSGAPQRIGFAHPRERQATMLYTSTVQTDARHVIDQNLALASALREISSDRQSSIDNRQSPFAVETLPIDPAAESRVWDRLPSAGPTTRFAILTPGAGWGAKQWPAARYGEVARRLRDEGISSLINYSPAEDSLAREVERTSDGAAQPFACMLSELVALTRRASLFIGGDTGPMHLANALGVPVVALFGPTDPARTGPYPPQSTIDNRQSKMGVGWPTLPADVAGGWGRSVILRHPSSQTERRHRPDADLGLLKISEEEVVNAARALLSRTPTPDTRHLTPQQPDSAERDQ